MYHFGFLMSQVAGHITNYRNLRSITEMDPQIRANWHEIRHFRPGGSIEKIREHILPFVSDYYSGITRASLEIRRALSEPYDAILHNTTESVFFARQLRRIPTMFDFDATPAQIDRMEEYDKGAAPSFTDGIKYRLWRNMVQSMRLLQAWSHWARDSVVNEYAIPAERVVINPPGVDLDYWRPRAGTPKQHDDPLRILFVGGDFQRKGGELLLEWYRAGSHPDVELHIVTREPVSSGSGVYVYHDMKPNSAALLKLYQQSDLFVLPSKGECFGIATVEAMAAGLPVIASTEGGIADIIDSGRNGYIVTTNDVVALGSAIEAILASPQKREMMGRESRLIAEQRFDLRRNTQRTLQTLKQIADEHRESVSARGESRTRTRRG
jgi:glycosyltransferase involved in cell wall biosynthesis